MNATITKPILAVVVGRFQTPYLHAGHELILNAASGNGERKLLVVIGVSGGAMSATDPLDFKTRALMIQERYPDAVIVQQPDNPSDELWSRTLDELIAETLEQYAPGYTPVLFGSRDSFIPYYHGRFTTELVDSAIEQSASSIRQTQNVALPSEDFRKGVIYANVAQAYPTSYQTIDVIIRHSLEQQVLVGRKVGETLWRFPGGFVDPQDESLEQAVKREVREELGDIEIDYVKYLRSIRVRDHRYRKSNHKIMTAVFTAIYIYGGIKAGDDLAEVRWQSIEGLKDCLMPVHVPLAEAYLSAL